MKKWKVWSIILIIILIGLAGNSLINKQKVGSEICPSEIPQDKVYLFQSIFYENSSNEFDTEFYGKFGTIGSNVCYKGNREGENINHKYCSSVFTTKQTISEEGIVQPTKSYNINIVADYNSCHIIGRASSTLRDKVECDIINIVCMER